MSGPFFLLTKVQRQDVLAIPNVERGADKSRRRPGVVRQDLRPRKHVQFLGSCRCQREVTAFVDNHEHAVGDYHLRSAERPFPPQLFSGNDINRRKECRPEVSTRTQDQVSDADGVAKVQAQPVVEPKLLDRGIAAFAR